MKVKEIPQDNIKTFKGFGTKAMYAVDENGRYARMPTSGWEAEEVVLRDVIDDFAKLAEQTKIRVFKGETSPIEYYMNKNYMDPPALARGMGLAKWRVKRHFNPNVFSRLNQKTLQSYADFFNIDVHTLKCIKENF
jgi:hypothetical protein